jgi:hypothetical protein
VSDQVQVNPTDLLSHAGRVDGVADDFSLARQTGAAVRADSAAYGKLCQIVPAFLDLLQDKVVDGIAAAAMSAYDTADALRATASDYDGSDSRAAGRIRSTR